MADRPEAKQSTTSDKTSALVAGGLVLLAVTGLVTIFSDSIAAAWSPPAAAAEPATASSPPPPAPLPDGGRP
jgi:hypothetical protein